MEVHCCEINLQNPILLGVPVKSADFGWKENTRNGRKSKSSALPKVMAVSSCTFFPVCQVRFGCSPYITLMVWRQTSECSLRPHHRMIRSAVETVCGPSAGTSEIRTAQCLVNAEDRVILPRLNLLTCILSSLDVCDVALSGRKMGRMNHCGRLTTSVWLKLTIFADSEHY
ncbi:hypothetical protein AVEN_254466-1 [Araneus ventricosus]|uniref:Uncharacterized protein n=1 Tax=Araneus ventricosus TaxID=182803 RepID=A0A4Y2KUL1_ARAVE|nr:hypothetical protein AVEN_254466-1 [Araneus ventricosus]